MNLCANLRKTEENMDQIRNTMMEHEALFKEQVQALHKLYSVQKSAMQEIRKRIYSQPQVLVVNCESVVLADGQLPGSVLEDKSLRPGYANGQSYKEERLSLSLHPFCTSEDFRVCDSSSMNGRGVETSRATQSKSVRNFDLEKLPEECMDESENQNEPSNSAIPDANSILSRRTSSTDDTSFLGDTILEPDTQISRQMYSGTDLRIRSIPSQEINLNSDQASGGKVCEIDIKKLDTSSHNSKSNTEKNTSQSFAHKYLAAVGNSNACEDSSHSANRHLEKPMLSHQGSSDFATQLKVSTKLQQYLESDSTSTISTAHRKSENQLNDRISGVSFTKSPVICSQGSFIQRSLSSGTNSSSGKQNLQSVALTSHIDGQNENSNDSGNGSNGIKCQDNSSCEDKIISTHRAVTEHDSLFNSRSNSNAMLGRAVVAEGEGDQEDKLAMHEASESIAAEILLSFVPRRSQVNHQLQGTRVKAEPGKPRDDNLSIEKKREQKGANSSSSGGIDDSIKWNKSVNRRRTTRRPR